MISFKGMVGDGVERVVEDFATSGHGGVFPDRVIGSEAAPVGPDRGGMLGIGSVAVAVDPPFLVGGQELLGVAGRSELHRQRVTAHTSGGTNGPYATLL